MCRASSDADVGHRRARREGRRVLQPGDQIGRRVRQHPAEVGALRQIRQRRPDLAVRAGHAGDEVAGGAAELADQRPPSLGVAAGDAQVRRRLAFAAGGEQDRQQPDHPSGHPKSFRAVNHFHPAVFSHQHRG